MPHLPTDNSDIRAVLRRLRDLRAERSMNSWYFRQALVLVLQIDTRAALLRGIKQKELDTFDELVRQDADKFVDNMAQG